MKKLKLKHFLIIVGTLLVLLFSYQFFTMHHSSFGINKKYVFIFKDSILNKVDTTGNFSMLGSQDIFNHFIYYDNLKDKKPYYEPNDTSYNNYYIIVWDFLALKNYKLEDSFINTKSIIGDPQFGLSEVLAPKTFCPITIRTGYKIDGMILNVDEGSYDIKELKGKNYKGFYGIVDKMSICNKEGEPQIYINFPKGPRPTELLLYKGHGGFYLIMVNATKRVDEDIYKIFNLN